MSEKIRFSERLKDYRDQLDALSEEERDKVQAAILRGIGEPRGEAKLVGGASVQVRPVNLSSLASDVPSSLREDTRTLVRAIGTETAKRGELWADTCLHTAIIKALFLPRPRA